MYQTQHTSNMKPRRMNTSIQKHHTQQWNAETQKQHTVCRTEFSFIHTEPLTWTLTLSIFDWKSKRYDVTTQAHSENLLDSHEYRLKRNTYQTGPQQTIFSSSPGFSVFTDSVSLVGMFAVDTQYSSHSCLHQMFLRHIIAHHYSTFASHFMSPNCSFFMWL